MEPIEELARLMRFRQAEHSTDLRDAWELVGQQYAVPVDATTAEEYARDYADTFPKAHALAVQQAIRQTLRTFPRDRVA